MREINQDIKKDEDYFSSEVFLKKGREKSWRFFFSSRAALPRLCGGGGGGGGGGVVGRKMKEGARR